MKEQNQTSLTVTQASDRLGKSETAALMGPHAPSEEAYGFGYGNIDAEDQIHLRDYWRAIRKRIWMVIGLTLLSGMLAAVYVARKPNIYEAQARVQVNLENASPIGNNAKSGAVVVSNQANDPAYFNTQLQILSGPGLLRRVVKTLDLENNHTFLKPGRNNASSTWQSMRAMIGLEASANSPDPAAAE
jgi:uncharacterized protein involved in exopolysaccharide biosynthesis